MQISIQSVTPSFIYGPFVFTKCPWEWFSLTFFCPKNLIFMFITISGEQNTRIYCMWRGASARLSMQMTSQQVIPFESDICKGSDSIIRNKYKLYKDGVHSNKGLIISMVISLLLTFVIRRQEVCRYFLMHSFLLNHFILVIMSYSCHVKRHIKVYRYFCVQQWRPGRVNDVIVIHFCFSFN